jgi:hypothetical protein
VSTGSAERGLIARLRTLFGDVWFWALGLLVGALLGVAVVILFSVRFVEGEGSALEASAVGLALSGAAILLGVLLGFLFGLKPETDKKDKSHLYDISDWLTKLLVGATLVQLGRVPDAAARFGSAIKPAFGDDSAGGVFGVAILVYFFIDGFFMGFVWSSVWNKSDTKT